MNWLLTIARLVRHAPGLNRAEPFWRRVRPVYQRLLDPLDRGVTVHVGSGRTLRVPVEFTGAIEDWKNYEPESVDLVAGWAKAHPEGVMLDLGCAIGMFAALALQHGPRLRVIAADADDGSLACARRFVLGDADRLTLLLGLLDAAQSLPDKWADAVNKTEQRLKDPKFVSGQAATRYVCLDDASAAELPHYSLDALGAATALPTGPLLIKCDVEGAELCVLRGAVGLLAARRPTMLISVHPPALPKHGHTVADVEAFLAKHGYRWRIVARDHEEHWLAEPIS